MKLLTIILSIALSGLTYAKINIHESDDLKTINTDTQWEDSLIGYMFYDAEFNLVNPKNHDYMIINTFPKGLIINKSNTPKNTNELIEQLSLLSQLNLNEDFYSENETFSAIETTKSKKTHGVFSTSQYKNNKAFNYIWLGVVNNHSVIIKIISKSENLNYTKSDMTEIVANLNIKDSHDQLADSKTIKSPYNFQFHKYPELIDVKSTGIDGAYRRMNLQFEEEDRASMYTISSVCGKDKIPYELLLSQILSNFGYENSKYRHIINYKNKNYYFNFGGYENKNGQFNTISFVTTNIGCQHVLTYITETDEPLLERFLKFVDHFEFNPDSNKAKLTQLNTLENTKYAQLLYEFGLKYNTLKAYNKSIAYYQKAYDIDNKNKYLYKLLRSNYDLKRYKEGLKIITNVQDKIQEQNFTLWKAWYLARLNQAKKSAKAFQIALDEKYSEDEDLFKYIDQLDLIKENQTIIKVANQFKNNVKDSVKLKIKIAKALSKTNKVKAKTYIKNLLNKQSIANKYQFDLYDYLGDIEAFNLIEKICLQRIDNGYESGILLNYLGDAQNNLGKTEQAYITMKKAHKLLPNNTIISDYYKSLQTKIGKSDVSSVEDAITVVKLPVQIKEKIKNIKAINNLDSYEYLYSINAYHHVIGEPNKRTLYGKIKIQNESGVAKNKTLYFGFNQEYEKAYLNSIRILDSQGNLIKEVDKSTTYITTDNDNTTGDDDKLLNVPIPNLSPGVYIEYIFTKENKSPNQTQDFIEKLFVSSVTMRYKAIVFEGDINNISISKSAGIIRHDVSDTLVYWDSTDIPNYKKTPYLPTFETIFPWIKFASTDKSWEQLSKDYLHKISKKINSEFTQKELYPFKKENKSINEIAQNIISFAQKNITYQAIEFGDRALIPNTAHTTLANKYGDCKDHSVVLFDMLNSAGINAKLALVNADNDIEQDIPNLGQFNHMIVYLPDINNGVFVDITDKDASIDFKNPPHNLQGYTSLVLDEQQPQLIKIPEANPDNNTIDVKRIVYEKDQKLFYSEKSVIKGYFATSLRNYLKSIEIDEIENRLIGWIGSYYTDLMIETFEFHNLYDNQQPLILEFTFSQNKEFISTKLPIFMEFYVMDFKQSPNRQWDFEYQTPFNLSSKTTIDPNSKLKFKKYKENNDTKLMKWDITSNQDTINFNSTVYANYLPAKEYKKMVNESRRSYKIIENLLRD